MNLTSKRAATARQAYALHKQSPGLTTAQLADELYRLGFTKQRRGVGDKFSPTTVSQLIKIGSRLNGELPVPQKGEADALLEAVSAILLVTDMGAENKLNVIRRIVGGTP